MTTSRGPTVEPRIVVMSESQPSETLDGRDYGRLVDFFPVEQWEVFGMKPVGDLPADWKPKEWTREGVIEQLKGDVAFGFEKGLGQRSISAGLMYSVVRTPRLNLFQHLVLCQHLTLPFHSACSSLC